MNLLFPAQCFATAGKILCYPASIGNHVPQFEVLHALLSPLGQTRLLVLTGMEQF